IIFVSGLHDDAEASPERYQRLSSRRMPMVLINGYSPEIEAPFISSDDEGSVDLAMRHLASQGHTRIGLAIGPHRFVPAQRKIRGFAKALSEHLGITEAEPHIATSLFTVEGGFAAATELI